MGQRMMVELALAMLQMVLGISMFTYGLARRDHAWRGFMVILAGPPILLACFYIMFQANADSSEALLALYNALCWIPVPVISIPGIMAFKKTDALSAAWCAAAGYTLQNLASSAADLIELILGAGSTDAVPLAVTLLVELLTAAVAYAAAWRLLVVPMHRHGLSTRGDKSALALLGVVFLAVILFDTVNKQLADMSVPLALVLQLKGIHCVVCVGVLAMSYELLVNRHLREESAVAQNMLEAERRQYELSRANIEAINIKCHDIRHQIRQLDDGHAAVSSDVLEDIAREVNVYDSLIHTGNDALDTILSEKGLICEQEGISFRCIADGTTIGFMAPTDIYALFGNALDNAIEASRDLGEPSDRSISLTVREAAGMASIHVENRFADEVLFGDDGLPLTSKGDTANHGFGTRSMRLVATRYDGTMATRVTGDVFHLNIALPLPE